MNMNVFVGDEMKMSNVSSTELRNELIHAVKMPSRLARQVIAIAMKQGVFAQGMLRVIVINHPKHHGRMAA